MSNIEAQIKSRVSSHPLPTTQLHKMSNTLMAYLILLAVICHIGLSQAQPMAPVMSLEQFQQLQQPMNRAPPVNLVQAWRTRRSLASGRWGLRPGKRSVNFDNPIAVGSYNPYEETVSDEPQSPQLYLLLART
ncbi:hypothetical protein Ddc_00817 [Ditylenchus destructor]|nr:hypothetical protein Ddc_00817 [Ditylenchus destructor]